MLARNMLVAPARLGSAGHMPDCPDGRAGPRADPSRRAFVGAVLAGAVAVRVGTAAAAPAKNPALSAEELRPLVAWYDTLVPGAQRARVGDFIQEQLRADPPFALLQLRYLNWPPPFAGFYRAGIRALNATAQRRGATTFDALPARDRLALAQAAVSGKLQGWPATPPLAAWVTATRADAMDVVYDTPAALAAHDMPMLQVPPPRW
jgi:hypothetical protein